MTPIRDPGPVVELLGVNFSNPTKAAIASARTCYSPRVIKDSEVTDSQINRIAPSTFDAGHHTIYQHATFTFGLENISRQLTWSFLHSHPFYNAEQTSQRYVEMKGRLAFIPPLKKSEHLGIFLSSIESSWEDYTSLIDILEPDFQEAMADLPILNKKKTARKKAVENGRYVLPVAAHTNMHHTISGLTLHRLKRMQNTGDIPYEASRLVNKMIESVRNIDPYFFDKLGPDPLPLEKTVEYQFFERHPKLVRDPACLAEFDSKLDGYNSRLRGYVADAEEIVAEAVREVMGVSSTQMSDEESLEELLNPARNPGWLESLVTTTHSPISRAAFHASYVFKKKISHTGDSQDQRHRMTPASRPMMTYTDSETPDVIIPEFIANNSEAKKVFDNSVKAAWEAKNELLEGGVEYQFAQLTLPNARALRFTESASLIHWLHKTRLRTCLNAQMEIYDHTMDEINQISEVHPRLVKYAGPPCVLRNNLVRPRCPEGSRYCGIRVWKKYPNVRRPY